MPGVEIDVNDVAHIRCLLTVLHFLGCFVGATLNCSMQSSQECCLARSPWSKQADRQRRLESLRRQQRGKRLYVRTDREWIAFPVLIEPHNCFGLVTVQLDRPPGLQTLF